MMNAPAVTAKRSEIRPMAVDNFQPLPGLGMPTYFSTGLAPVRIDSSGDRQETTDRSQADFIMIDHDHREQHGPVMAQHPVAQWNLCN
jgi:hypothetical protein